jgi:hypothetical protein
MAKGKPGADSSVAVTSQVGGTGLIDLATTLFGETPVFWGRYFTSTGTGGTVEYRHLRENQPLRDRNIRVLPIARQTRNVGGAIAQGSADAQQNADDVLATFGADYLASQGGRFCVFLDVEGSPSLSADYYGGWAQTLEAHSMSVTGGRVTLLPALYAARGDAATWQAMADAVKSGAGCIGVWVARYRLHGCQALPDWDDALVAPETPIPCKVLIWQYSDECQGNGGFDCSETNPAIDLQAELLNYLVLPPDMTAFVT